MTGIIFLLMPIIIGAVVALAKPKPAVSWTDKLNDWIIEKRGKFAEKDDTLSKYFFRPLFWGLYKIIEWTGKKFEDEFVRSGVRITLVLYFIAVTAFVAYIMIVVIIAIIILVLLLWIISRILFGEEEKEAKYAGHGYSSSSYQIQQGKEVNPIFRTSKIDKALFSDDKILKDKDKTVGKLTKGGLFDSERTQIILTYI